jgi:hypothetical protein
MVVERPPSVGAWLGRGTHRNRFRGVAAENGSPTGVGHPKRVYASRRLPVKRTEREAIQDSFRGAAARCC